MNRKTQKLKQNSMNELNSRTGKKKRSINSKIEQ